MAKAMPVVVVAASVVVVVVTLTGGTNLADVFIWGEGRLSGTETGTVRDCSDPDEVDEASHWQTACVAANSLFSLHRGSFTATVNDKYQTGTYMRSIVNDLRRQLLGNIPPQRKLHWKMILPNISYSPE